MSLTNVKVPEILAPAGGREQFFAALNSGADAVYLGLKEFNARARASNFTIDDLRELVPLAHDYGMRVLVTLNVLIKQDELRRLIDDLADLAVVGVDAVIVQDLAVARIVQRYFPGLRLHASTQMAVHNLAGVRQVAAFGFRRVVLARELTALELRKIRAEVPREIIELESFCHGSLCYSYSGLCFFSGASDGRSGNRGECAYTCRQGYKIVSEPGQGFLFSMRDLDTAANLSMLVQAGVDCLKIEGRKKDAQYVASVTQLYRRRLDEVFGYATLRQNAPTRAQELNGSVEEVRRDLAFSFGRQATSLFVRGRYRENVIDLNSPTHRGVLIGEITAVEGQLITLTTSEPLELHDGLRIEMTENVYHAQPQHGSDMRVSTNAMQQRYNNDYLEFSLKDLRVDGSRTVKAMRGARVSIQIPPDSRSPLVGELVFKVRAADLRSRTDRLATAPSEAKVKPWTLLEARWTISDNGNMLCLAVAVSLGEHILCEDSVTAERITPEKAARLQLDLEQDFTVLGDIEVKLTPVSFSGDFNWFIPRSQLKNFKRQLSAKIAHYLNNYRNESKAACRAAVLPQMQRPLTPALDCRFAIKVDREKSLRDVLAYYRAHPGFPLREIIFEPKKAFLSSLDPQGFADFITEAEHEIPIRLSVPTVIRTWDEPLLGRWLQACYREGLRRFEIGNIGAISLLASWGLTDIETTADFTLYTLNSEAAAFWSELGLCLVTLSLEDDQANMKQILEALPAEKIAVQAILYKDTPLFIAEACSLTALHNGCPTAAVCGYRTLEIENQAGERFFVAHESCKSIVYGKHAFSLTQAKEQLMEWGIRDFRLDFLTREYAEAEIAAVLTAAASGSILPQTHSANFEHSLL